jgi:hypothetical protein
MLDTDSLLSYLIIFLSSIAMGMITGLIIIEDKFYHGPNANKFTKKVYIDKNTSKCYHFSIKLSKCK